MLLGSLEVACSQPGPGEIYEDAAVGVGKLDIPGDVEGLLQDLSRPIELAFGEQQVAEVVERHLQPPRMTACTGELDALLVQPLRLVQLALCLGGPAEQRSRPRPSKRVAEPLVDP